MTLILWPVLTPGWFGIRIHPGIIAARTRGARCVTRGSGRVLPRGCLAALTLTFTIPVRVRCSRGRRRWHVRRATFHRAVHRWRRATTGIIAGIDGRRRAPTRIEAIRWTLLLIEYLDLDSFRCARLPRTAAPIAVLTIPNVAFALTPCLVALPALAVGIASIALWRSKVVLTRACGVRVSRRRQTR